MNSDSDQPVNPTVSVPSLPGEPPVAPRNLLSVFQQLMQPPDLSGIYKLMTPADMGGLHKLITPPNMGRIHELMKPQDLSGIHKLMTPPDMGRIHELMKPPDLSGIHKWMTPPLMGRIHELMKPPDLSGLIRAIERSKVDFSSLQLTSVRIERLREAVQSLSEFAPTEDKSEGIESASWQTTRDTVFATWGEELQNAMQVVDREIAAIDGFDSLPPVRKIECLSHIVDTHSTCHGESNGLGENVGTCCVDLSINILATAIAPFCGPYAWLLCGLIVISSFFLRGKGRVLQTRRILERSGIPLSHKKFVRYNCKIFAQPRSKAKVIGQLDCGDVVDTQSKLGGWQEIAFFNIASSQPITGWVQSKYLKKITRSG